METFQFATTAELEDLRTPPGQTRATQGRFHVYAARTVDEAISALTGVPAGERQTNGRFPDGTINSRVEHRLIDLAHRRQEFIHEGGERHRFGPTTPATHCSNDHTRPRAQEKGHEDRH